MSVSKPYSREGRSTCLVIIFFKDSSTWLFPCLWGVTSHKKSIFYHRQSRGKRCVFLYFYKLPQTLQALGCGPPSCTQGAVEQGGCWICCVMETWSLREAGWCQSPGDRQLWQSYGGVGCPQWWSDGLQHLRTSQLAAGPAGKHCVHSLPQRCSQAVN